VYKQGNLTMTASFAAPSTHFFILHGWQGSDAPHWQSWIAGELRGLGHAVTFPELPLRDTPQRDAWLAALHGLREQLTPQTTVLCHSLGSALWLHYSALYSPRVARVLLVSPPGKAALTQFASEMQGFLPVPIHAAALKAAALDTQLVCTKGDPFCVETAAALYGKPLELPFTELPPELGHLNATAGLGPWPQALQWCLGQRERITGVN
jgi:uncharacterized protein